MDLVLSLDRRWAASASLSGWRPPEAGCFGQGEAVVDDVVAAGAAGVAAAAVKVIDAVAAAARGESVAGIELVAVVVGFAAGSAAAATVDSSLAQPLAQVRGRPPPGSPARAAAAARWDSLDSLAGATEAAGWRPERLP